MKILTNGTMLLIALLLSGCTQYENDTSVLDSCGNIENLANQSQCYLDESIFKRDPLPCLKLPGHSIFGHPNTSAWLSVCNCLTSVAVITSNVSICDKAPDKQCNELCQRDYITDMERGELMDKYDSYIKQIEKAIETKNENLCLNITECGFKVDCINKVAEAKHDEKICDFNLDCSEGEFKRNMCVQMVKDNSSKWA